MATLDQRQRNVLQMNLVQGLSIDEVGRVYAVHRATAARWVSAAREQLVSQTRTRLAERLNLQSNEVIPSEKGDLAIALGTYRTTYRAGVKEIQDIGKYVTIFHHGDSGWKIIVDTFNSDQPAPEESHGSNPS